MSSYVCCKLLDAARHSWSGPGELGVAWWPQSVAAERFNYYDALWSVVVTRWGLLCRIWLRALRGTYVLHIT